MMNNLLYAGLNAIREECRGKMNSAASKAEEAAAIGEMGEVSVSSTESERYREAFVALNRAIAVVEAAFPDEEPSDKPAMPAHAYARQWARDTLSGPADGRSFEWGDRNLARSYLNAVRILEQAQQCIAGDTPEDARADTFEKIRTVLNA